MPVMPEAARPVAPSSATSCCIWSRRAVPADARTVPDPQHRRMTIADCLSHAIANMAASGRPSPRRTLQRLPAARVHGRAEPGDEQKGGIAPLSSGWKRPAGAGLRSRSRRAPAPAWPRAAAHARSTRSCSMATRASTDSDPGPRSARWPGRPVRRRLQTRHGVGDFDAPALILGVADQVGQRAHRAALINSGARPGPRAVQWPRT